MQRRVYVNKSSSWGREFFGFLLIIALIGVACGIAWWTLRDDGRSEDEPAQQASALRHADDAPALQCAEDAPADLRALFEMVRASPHVIQNEMYSAVARNIRFVYDSQDDEINAYATLESLGGSARRPVVVLLAGFTRLAAIAALTLADSHHSGDLGKIQLLVQNLRDKWHGTLSRPQAGLFAFESGLPSLEDDDKVVEEAKGIEAGMLIAAIAHEVGHLALGHLYRTENEMSAEISRNQEREADLFASSVMSASPFGQYIFEGFFLFHFVNAAEDGMERDYKARTHPYSRERLINLIRQNQSKAKALGLTEEKVLQLIPPISNSSGARLRNRLDWIFGNAYKETSAVLPSGTRQLAKVLYLSNLWRLNVQAELYMACNGRRHAFEEEWP